MKRTPILAKGYEAYRVCSIANGLWQAQAFVGGKGTNYKRGTKDVPTVPHFDPWQGLHSPTTLDNALARMQLACVPQPEVKTNG